MKFKAKGAKTRHIPLRWFLFTLKTCAYSQIFVLFFLYHLWVFISHIKYKLQADKRVLVYFSKFLWFVYNATSSPMYGSNVSKERFRHDVLYFRGVGITWSIQFNTFFISYTWGQTPPWSSCFLPVCVGIKILVLF